MSILDIFKKDPEFIAGLNIDNNGDFQFIELQKINNSHFPIFNYRGILEDFTRDGMFKKKSFIEKFKKIKSESRSEKIFLNSFGNKKLENEIKSALKIAGFENISIVPSPNIYGIVLPEHNVQKSMSVFFNSPNIEFITTEYGKIINKEMIKMSNFRVSTVSRITKILDNKHIFLINVEANMLDAVEGIFYQSGIKTHQKNIWENFLSFSDGIPDIFPSESHNFIDALSISIPNLKRWTDPKERKEINVKKDLLKIKTIFLPKPKNIKGADKKYKKIDRLDNQMAIAREHTPRAISKVEKELDYNLEDKALKYLPKKIKKIFLPKPKSSGAWKKIKSILKSEI